MKIAIEIIDELTGDIISELFPAIEEGSDDHDNLYTNLHNFLTGWFKDRR